MSTEYAIPEDLSIPEWMKRPKVVNGELRTPPREHGNTPACSTTPGPDHWQRNLTAHDLEVIAELTKGQTGTKKIKDTNRITKMLGKMADKDAIKDGKRWDGHKGKWV